MIFASVIQDAIQSWRRGSQKYGFRVYIPVRYGTPMVSHTIVRTSHFLKDAHGFGIGIRVLSLAVVSEHTMVSFVHFKVSFSDVWLGVTEGACGCHFAVKVQ